MTLFSAYFCRLAFLWISIFWVGSCQIAQAHLISAGNAAITVNPDRGVLLVGVPVSFFKGIDQNQDGLLQPIEIKESRLQMIQQLESAFQLKIGGTAVEVVDDQLITSIKADHQDGAPQIDWFRLLKVQPADLNLPIEVTINKALLTSQYVFQVKRMDSEELAVLNPSRPSHTFFKNNWGTLQSFFVEGWVHIVTGYDHLIFIMAMLVAAINLKRWLWVLSSFTVAHGVTYSLATFGLVQVKPEWIEPIIALTIVATAAFGLFKVQLLIRTEMLVVFALGLFHGLGFASAMASQLNTLRFPITSVIGFNLGVEAGQIAIALGVWLFFNFIKSSAEWTERAKSVTLWASFLLGGLWLFERIS